MHIYGALFRLLSPSADVPLGNTGHLNRRPNIVPKVTTTASPPEAPRPRAPLLPVEVGILDELVIAVELITMEDDEDDEGETDVGVVVLDVFATVVELAMAAMFLGLTSAISIEETLFA